MAGSLIKVDEFTISSPVASVILGGGSSGSSGLNASIDSTYDVYMVVVSNASNTVSDEYFYQRVTVPTPSAGTPDTSANYDLAGKQLNADAAFINQDNTNETAVQAYIGMGADNGETPNLVSYLFNFNNASEYSFATIEVSSMDSSSRFRSIQGGWVHTVAQSCNGIQFYAGGSRNLDSGLFRLFGLAK